MSIIEKRKGKRVRLNNNIINVTLFANINGTETDPVEFALYFHAFLFILFLS
jgi:hypothetical protein